jgi:hypothetical protein
MEPVYNAYMLSGESTNTNFIDFGLTRSTALEANTLKNEIHVISSVQKLKYNETKLYE